MARFLPGLRTPIFFSCGTLKMKFALFFLIDSLAAILSVPIFTLLGYFFGDKIDVVISHIKRIDRIVVIILILTILLIYLLKRVYSKKIEKTTDVENDNIEKNF